MRICKIWDADYPWDIRVEKVAESLSAAGHAVHLVCRNLGRLARVEPTGTFTIHRLPVLPRAFGRLHAVGNFPHPLNPVWMRAIEKVVRSTRADLILVRDIPLVLAAAALGKLYRLPVVLDMAENYPAMLSDRLQYTATGPLGRLVRQPALARFIERVALRLVDHTIVVVEESSERLVKAGVAPSKLSIVSNTPRLDRWERSNGSGMPSPGSTCPSIVYLGNLDGSRGVETAIRAVHRLKAAGHPAGLIVIGDGPSIGALRRLVSDLDVSDSVRLTGRLPFREVQSELAQANIGLIPHYSTEAWNTTIPNKLFDYMLLGLPVIVSDARPTARIVREASCGEVFRDRSVEDLARCIVALDGVERRARAGEKGRAAILERYNWARDSQVLIETIERVANAGLRGR